MTRTTAARIAGFALLFYIAIGITSAIVAGGAMPMLVFEVPLGIWLLVRGVRP